MSNGSESVNLSGNICAACGGEVVAGTRAVLFGDKLAYHRPCWSGIVNPQQPTPIGKRMARDWSRPGRCRLAG